MKNGRLLRLPFFYLSPVKTPADLTKMCRSRKFGFVGLRLLGFCGVGGVFVLPKSDALETAPMRLYGQNSFHALFSRVKLMPFSGTYIFVSVPLIFLVRFVTMGKCHRTTLSSDQQATCSSHHYGLPRRMSRYCVRC